VSIWDDFKQDPAGGGLAIALPALFVMCGIAAYQHWGEPDAFTAPEPQRTAKPLQQPPLSWEMEAPPGDHVQVPGLPVAYWGRPDRPYGRVATAAKRPYRGIVVHYTLNLSPVNLVKYQHAGDGRRGGHFGYHFYVDKAGRVLQGAPMSKRTNHIRGPASSKRKPGVGVQLSSRNTIGVSMVGACVAQGRGLGVRCVGEKLTAKQKRAGLRVIEALLKRYRIACAAVFGHGELQTNRAEFEGITLAAHVRKNCPVEVAKR